MYLKSDVQLLPSTLRPNYLHSRQRSLPRCNIYILFLFFLYAYIHDKLSDHFLDIFLLVLYPGHLPPGLFPDTQLVALETNVEEG